MVHVLMALVSVIWVIQAIFVMLRDVPISVLIMANAIRMGFVNVI